MMTKVHRETHHLPAGQFEQAVAPPALNVPASHSAMVVVSAHW